jgi:HTH-type transcriptional regulator / antitoxin HigA
MNAPSGSPEEARLLEISDLVEAYEEEHYPMGEADAVSIVKFYMDQLRLTRRDLEPLLGGPRQVSAVLNRRRPLTLDMIRRLHAKLGIRLDLLIDPYPITPSRSRSKRTSTRVPPSNGRDQETSAPIKSAR